MGSLPLATLAHTLAVVFFCLFCFVKHVPAVALFSTNLFLRSSDIFILDNFCDALPEMDEEDCERRRTECLDEMSNLEKQFTDLKDQ